MATIINRRDRIKKSIRQKISGTAERPRLTIYRSNTGIYAQLIDDSKGITLASTSSKVQGLKGSNVAVATEVGKKLAENAKNAGITQVVFDRNGYLYHGKVKALADGAREGGLNF
jgi:large subunit ribosomal protein L18